MIQLLALYNAEMRWRQCKLRLQALEPETLEYMDCANEINLFEMIMENLENE